MPSSQRPSPESGRGAVATGSAAESVALRAFAVLECVARSMQPLSLDEITQQLGLPKPTVFRILGLLRNAGLLRRDARSKRFTAGPRLTAFAVDLWRNASLRVQWHQALQIARIETGESCGLTMLEDNRVLYVDRVETAHALRVHVETGTRVPLHCTSSGKLFLSAMSAAEMRAAVGPEPYERFTPRTITRLVDLKTEIERTRSTGVGICDAEHLADTVAIAVPVKDPAGRFFAAVALHAPVSRLSLRSARALLPALNKAAAAIAATLKPEPPAAAATAPKAKARGPRNGAD